MKPIILSVLVLLLAMAALAGLSPPTQKKAHPSMIASAEHRPPAVALVTAEVHGWPSIKENQIRRAPDVVLNPNERLTVAEVNAVARSGSHSMMEAASSGEMPVLRTPPAVQRE